MAKREILKEHKLRAWIENNLRTAPDIERFCLNFFPTDVAQRLNPGMQTVQMLNILFASKAADDILAALRQEFPQRDLDAELGSTPLLTPPGTPAGPAAASAPHRSAAFTPAQRLGLLIGSPGLLALVWMAYTVAGRPLVTRVGLGSTPDQTCHLGKWIECFGLLTISELGPPISEDQIENTCGDAHVQILSNTACEGYRDKIHHYLAKMVKSPDQGIEALCFKGRVGQACMLGGQKAYRQDKELKNKENVCRWYRDICKGDTGSNWQSCLVPYLSQTLFNECISASPRERYIYLRKMCQEHKVASACSELGNYCNIRLGKSEEQPLQQEICSINSFPETDQKMLAKIGPGGLPSDGERHYQAAFLFYRLGCELRTRPDPACHETGYELSAGCDPGVSRGCFMVAQYYRRQALYTDLHEYSRQPKDRCTAWRGERQLTSRALSYYSIAAVLPLAEPLARKLRDESSQQLAELEKERGSCPSSASEASVTTDSSDGVSKQ